MLRKLLLIGLLGLAACEPYRPPGFYSATPQEQADWLYCDLQGQMASNMSGGGLYGSAAYAQARSTCLEMKAVGG